MNNDEFKKAMRALPEPPNDSHPPLWDYWRHDLWERAMTSYDPQGFFGWPCIYHTMRVDHWKGATAIELERISGNQRLLDACVMPEFGYPRDYFTGKYSAALIHQAHHLYQWMQFSGKDVADLSSIFEFGGGYGAMALVVRRMGFKGAYHIYDLPEFMVLQDYFLSNTGVDDVHWFNPPKVIHPKTGRYDLFIACFSLSEADLPLRHTILENMPANHYLFLYTGKFADYDNAEYFSYLAPTYIGKDYTWKIRHADHLPDLNYYAFGRKRGV